MISVGVIGYGYWGPNLVRNLTTTDGVRVVSIADRAPKRLELAARRYPELRCSLDAATVLDDDEIDAVVIAMRSGGTRSPAASMSCSGSRSRDRLRRRRNSLRSQVKTAPC